MGMGKLELFFMSKQLITTVDLIRHGEPVGGSRYRGQIDDPLSELGWEQMREAMPETIPWQRIISSPLTRCSAFAQELAEQNNLPLSQDSNFKEIGFGVWEGMTRDQLRADDPTIIERFFKDPVTNRPEGAERLVDFKARVEKAITDITIKHQGKHVLVVAHAGVIRAAMCYVLGMPIENMFRIKVTNASITRLQLADGAPAVMLFHEGQP